MGDRPGQEPYLRVWAFYGVLMQLVSRWALLSSGCAPVLFAGGWAIAAVLEGPAYDPATQTISVLAAYGAAGFWVMTGGLLALGVCHLLTAWGLRAAALAGRVALAGGERRHWALHWSPHRVVGGLCGTVSLPGSDSLSWRCGRSWPPIVERARLGDFGPRPRSRRPH